MFASDLSLSMALAKVITADDITNKVRELRFSALRQLQGYLNYYRKEGFLECLIDRIAEKKIKMIMEATSKTEIEKIVNPPRPRFDGSKFITDSYHVAEEELICWSQTSLRAPLSDAGFKRYLQLFNQVFPEESKALDLQYK